MKATSSVRNAPMGLEQGWRGREQWAISGHLKKGAEPNWN